MKTRYYFLVAVMLTVAVQAQTIPACSATPSLSDKLSDVNFIVTSIYSLLTFFILLANRSAVSAMRSQQDSAMRPYIDVSMTVRTSTNLLRLSIKNTGKTQAVDLRLKLDRDFFQMGNFDQKHNLRYHPAFTNEIKGFAPGAELLFDLGFGPAIYSAVDADVRCPHVFKVVASYGVGKKMVTEESIVDLGPYIDSTIPMPPIAEEIVNLRKELIVLREALENKSTTNEMRKFGDRLTDGRRQGFPPGRRSRRSR